MEEKKMNNKKKTIIIILAIIIILVIMYIFMPVTIKGYLIFGNKRCNQNLNFDIGNSFGDSEHPLIAGSAVTPYTCKLCGKKGTNSNTAIPKICYECAHKTGRCASCGGLK